jgi:predicted MPP superfamily phosphohydrolase
MGGQGFLAVVAIWLLCWACHLAHADPSNKRPLRLKEDFSFKIVQFTDLHFGEGRQVGKDNLENIPFV